MTMFNNQAVLFFLSTTATRLSAVQANGGSGFYSPPITCEGFPCGPGFVCQMVEPPSCPYDSCAVPQCRPPTSCDDVECQPGFVCVVDSPPGNCPRCQPRAFCKPENQGICDAGEAYDYQKGKCVPYTCEATNACPADSACLPTNPGTAYCRHKYATTGVPCQFFTCGDDGHNPCAATTCLVGSICQVVNGAPTCVCNEPTYKPVGYACVPNSCDAVNACPAGTTCIPGTDPPFTCSADPPGCPEGFVWDPVYHKCVHDDGPPGCPENFVWDPVHHKCVHDDGPPGCPEGFVWDPVHHKCVHDDDTGCDDGYQYDPYRKKCVAVSCEADPCPQGLVCIDDDDIVCVTAPCFKFVCQTCGHGYEYDDIAGKCVEVDCRAPTACPSDKVCVDNDKITCVRSPCAQFTCEDHPPVDDVCKNVWCGPHSHCDGGVCCPKGTAYDESKYTCIPVTCEAWRACPPSKTCVDAEVTCQSTLCPKFTCEDKTGGEDPCDDPTFGCPDGYVCKSYPDGYGKLRAYCVCPDNYDYHPAFGCVPRNCEAPDACPEGKDCVPRENHCNHPGHCRQFYCKGA